MLCFKALHFQSVFSLLKDVDTSYNISKYFSDQFFLVKQTKIFLGYRSKTVRNNGKKTQVLISDKFQYISIMDTIRFLFSSAKMQCLSTESNRGMDDKM